MNILFLKTIKTIEEMKYALTVLVDYVVSLKIPQYG